MSFVVISFFLLLQLGIATIFSLLLLSCYCYALSVVLATDLSGIQSVALSINLP